ncbi:MAG: prepilin-type N-terminal cleavage/methylation domain-containing protein [Lentisphaerae bacterium]|nr:prepilin-type N-terminal cleavage/methylation domain-containing protein [Lentisphaerota bacterium]
MKKHTFTLVELIAAMAVLALIGSASAAALVGFQRSHDKVATLSERLERNRKLDKVAELMTNMIPFFWKDETDDNQEHLVFDGMEDELYFTAMRLPDSQGRGAFIFVRLYINDDNALACDYKDTPLLPWLELDEQSNIKTVILAENVANLTFTYADYDEDDEIEWLEVWDQDDEEYEDRLPAAVGFTVEFENGEKLSYLRRTAGLSAFTGLAL